MTKKAGLVLAISATFVVLAGVVGYATLNQGEKNRDELQATNKSPNAESVSLNENEIMFAQMMIPHHQQAVEMSDLALKISSNSQVLALAKQIRAAQSPEIDLMTQWLIAAGVEVDAHHSMTGGGMLNEADMTSLQGATGTEFDRLFLEGMIAHHQGAIQMADMIQNSSNPSVNELGQNISTSQTAEIESMKKMLEEL